VIAFEAMGMGEEDCKRTNETKGRWFLWVECENDGVAAVPQRSMMRGPSHFLAHK
jgi:hypothetical protein